MRGRIEGRGDKEGVGDKGVKGRRSDEVRWKGLEETETESGYDEANEQRLIVRNKMKVREGIDCM